MAKARKVFLCSDCGFESPKWEGRCPSCKEWNTMVEYKIPKSGGGGAPPASSHFENQPVLLPYVTILNLQRWKPTWKNMHRCMVGGTVPGRTICATAELSAREMFFLIPVIALLARRM